MFTPIKTISFFLRPYHSLTRQYRLSWIWVKYSSDDWIASFLLHRWNARRVRSKSKELRKKWMKWRRKKVSSKSISIEYWTYGKISLNAMLFSLVKLFIRRVSWNLHRNECFSDAIGDIYHLRNLILQHWRCW